MTQPANSNGPDDRANGSAPVTGRYSLLAPAGSRRVLRLPRSREDSQDTQPDRELAVSSVIASYLVVAAHDLSVRCFKEHKRIFVEFSVGHAHMKAMSLTALDLLTWVNAHKGWKSDWTRKRAANTINRAFSFAAKCHLLPYNPVSGVKYRPGGRGRPLTDEEFRSLLRGSSACFRRALIFLRYTGCRPGEMSQLTWNNIDWQRACAVLTHHKTERTGKPRILVFHSVIVRLLQWIRRKQPEGQFVFANHYGGRWTQWSMSMRMLELRERFNLPKDCKFYGLRHKSVTQAILNDVPIATVAELHGHASVRTTQIYVHIAGNLSHLHAAVDRIFQKKQS